MSNGMGSHQSHKMETDEWLTPPDILAKLGNFDLDPCAPAIRPWVTAESHYSRADDGLSKDWAGRVWCNPPYGAETVKWLRRMADHKNGIALIFARTETKMFFETVWMKAIALLFIRGRLHFCRGDGVRAKFNAGAPSVLVAYSVADADILAKSGIPGAFVFLRNYQIRGEKS